MKHMCNLFKTILKYSLHVHIFLIVFINKYGFCFRVKFNRFIVKCLDCKAIAHVEHKDKVPLPCIPVKSTPSKNGVSFLPIYN